MGRGSWNRVARRSYKKNFFMCDEIWSFSQYNAIMKVWKKGWLQQLRGRGTQYWFKWCIFNEYEVKIYLFEMGWLKKFLIKFFCFLIYYLIDISLTLKFFCLRLGNHALIGWVICFIFR
jgi:hypothetical protein